MKMKMLPYSRQWLDDDDIAAIVDVLRSDWLTTGPRVEEFEQAFADFVGASEAVAVSSGTAALHSAMYALGIGPGDEVIVPAMTFAATANSVLYQGGTPVFADVDRNTLLIDPASVESRITHRTKAVVAVDYAGQPCDYDELRAIAGQHGLALVADACHALGGSYKGRPVGSLADLNTFSFHPVKPITTGEGGMITTDDPLLARRMRTFRNHGITTDHHQREQNGSWFYEMVELGYNYRITDFQCALGTSQLKKLPSWLNRRCEIAAQYDEAFNDLTGVTPVGLRADVLSARSALCSQLSVPGSKLQAPSSTHAYHLYVVRLDSEQLQATRADAFAKLRAAGIGVNVHYVPVHLHPYYRQRAGTGPGLCPVAEAAYESILSLPIFPRMDQSDVERVVTALRNLVPTQHPTGTLALKSEIRISKSEANSKPETGN